MSRHRHAQHPVPLRHRLPVPPPRAIAYAAAVAVPVLEAIGLRAVGMVSTLPLAAQASAVPSVAAFHDVRWLLVYAASWPVLAGEVIVAVALRAVLATLFVRTTWPWPALPSWRRLLVRNAVAAFLLLVAFSPWAVLAFVSGISSLSFPLGTGIFGALLVGALVTAHAGVAARWWTRWPPWRAMVWTTLDFMAVALAAVGIAYTPGWAVLAPAAVGGLLNGICWERVVRSCATEATTTRRSRPRRAIRLAVVPLSMFLVVGGLPVATATGVAKLGTGYPPAQRDHQDPPAAGQRGVLTVDGFQSNWNGGPPPHLYPGFFTTEYSYAGLSPSGSPLPYSGFDTTLPLPLLAKRMAAQIARLHTLTHRRVDVVAVSEGTYIVRQYLADHPHPPLRVVVLASPLPRPDRTYYPPSGATGFGLVGGAETHLLLEVARQEDPTEDIDTGMPMIRSLVGQGPLFRQRMLCPVPGVRIVALLPLTAAVVDPPGPVGGVPEGVVPGIHGTLTARGAVRRELVRVLHGRPLGHYFGWGIGFQLIRYAASAFEIPSLPLATVPAWRRRGGTRWGDAAFGGYGCPALDHPSAEVHGSAVAKPHLRRAGRRP